MNRLLVMIVAIAGLLMCAAQAQKPHLFSVRDSIELTTFNEPSELEHDAKPILSPNGAHFLVVTTRGLVRSDQVESTLWIYNTASVQSFVARRDGPPEMKPRLLVSMVGSPMTPDSEAYSALITDPRWSTDSQRVYFLRQNTTGEVELCEVDIRNAAVQRLTPRGYDVHEFAVAGTVVAATVSRPPQARDSDSDTAGELINKNASRVTGLPLVKILFPDLRNQRQDVKDIRLWIAEKGTTGRILSGASSAQIDTGVIDMLSIAPNGKSMVRLVPVASIPNSWADYEPLSILPRLRIVPDDPQYVSPRNIMRLKSYAILDLKTGKEIFRLSAPNSRPMGFGILDKAIWSIDERRLLLTNTYLPLGGTTDEERTRRLNSCVVADVELPSQDVRCIAFSHHLISDSDRSSRPPWLGDVSFGKDKDEVVLRYGGASGKDLERYRLHGERWVLEGAAADENFQPNSISSNSKTSANEVEIRIRQTLNSSPVLWATETSSQRAKPLWDPNPQLADMRLGGASIYHWKDADGVAWTGGLIKPVDYIPGKRYPLVIQTHGFWDGIFKGVTDGAFPTAMAARPLASIGIMVLQIPDNRGNEFVTSAEALRHVEGFRSAIEQLTAEGLVDPEHVGVIGFSRTCWYVERALIEYPNLFAAATIVDGVDESYMQYLLFAQEAESWGEEFEKINQAKPIREGLQNWFKLAPGFHLDRVKTPLRIEALGPRSILLEWEIYSSLQQQGKPVDLIYIPNGQHILQRPLDRMASQQGNVDWFQFWLVGSCCRDGVDQGEYHQWEMLRGQKPYESSPN